jgi:VWFA-related protein
MKNLLLIFICSFVIATAYSQEQPKQDFSIRVGVEEVRIDAVVLDKKGNQVVDLTSGDFEVYQDGKPQQIISSVYISDAQKRDKPVASPEAAKAGLLLSKPKLSKDEVRRTIAFLVTGRGYESRIAIRKFIETQMEPGDLITILGGGALMGAQQFSSDKKQLMLIVTGMPGHQTTGRPGGIVDASRSNDAIQSSTTRTVTFDSLLSWETDEQYIQRLKALIAPIRYAIRALRDMPGRKYLILMREGLSYDGRKLPRVQERLFNEAANEAWLAGVVIFTLDMKGLTTDLPDPYGQKYIPLSKKTGGIVVENSNFLFKGVKPVQEAIRGYYLLSYIPPPNTFDSKRVENYHRIRVNVKRSGTEVHSRDGFLGTSAPSDFASVPHGNTLQQAIFSPLLYSDLKLSFSTGYAHAPATGYFLRSWMHLDGNELAFVDDGTGEHSLLLELLSLTSDSNGRIQDTKGFRYDFQLSDADIALIKKYGIDLKTYLPVQNPGHYYVSVAIKDRTSGKIGSGYQFLDIPDLRNFRLSLSSILAIYNNKDESVLRSGNIEEDADSYNAMKKWRALSKSPALRKYRPGESFDYMMFVYNANSKNGKSSTLELKSTLFKDGQVYSQEAEDLDLKGMDSPGRIPILRRLILNNMDEGDYLLQLTVTDKLSTARTAAQAIDFQIRKE